ncbi:MAG: hypothetical protein CSB24_01185 [Deltaproteobacteria bacterium]|nr:MAG: hypothetical protein CSB24_01185 [Deltaproteobacteria bacterium]
MKARHNTKSGIIKQTWLTAFILLFFMGLSLDAGAGMRTPPPERIEVIMVGDRLVDIAYHLGVLPRAMSVRGSQWEMAKKLKVSSQILGCPMYTTVKKKETIPNALKKFGIKRVMVEKSTPFCLYKPQVKPENIAEILAGTDAVIEYVDFSAGLDAAVRQTAKLLDREAQAEALIEKYHASLTKAQKKLPKNLGKKVLVINGTYQKDTGKTAIRVEAPGFYSDRFFLKPTGCVNAGDAFKPAGGKAEKGYYPVRKKKNGMDLSPLIKANPDIIILTGSSYAAASSLHNYLKNNPELAKVPAIKNMAVYDLPLYVDSSVLELPQILLQWGMALGN